MRPLLLIPLLLLLVLSLPVLLPILAFAEARDLRRRRRAALHFACLHCGVPLGTAALDRADAAWAAEWAERRARQPHVMWRVVRRVWAICETCGARYDFRDGTFNGEAVPSEGKPGTPPLDSAGAG